MIMPYSFSKPIYALQNEYFCQIAKNVLFKQFKEKFTSLPFDTGELVKTWRSQAAGKLGPGSRQAWDTRRDETHGRTVHLYGSRVQLPWWRPGRKLTVNGLYSFSCSNLYAMVGQGMRDIHYGACSLMFASQKSLKFDWFDHKSINLFIL